ALLHPRPVGDHAIVQKLDRAAPGLEAQERQHGMDRTGEAAREHLPGEPHGVCEMLAIGLADRPRMLGEEPSERHERPPTLWLVAMGREDNRTIGNVFAISGSHSLVPCNIMLWKMLIGGNFGGGVNGARFDRPANPQAAAGGLRPAGVRDR